MTARQEKIKGAVRRVAFLWSTSVLAGTAIVKISPSIDIGIEHLLLRSSGVMAMLICIELWKIETSKGKPTTLNLAIVFGCLGIMVFLAETGAVMILTKERFAGFYVSQYANTIYEASVLYFAVFLLIDTLTTITPFKKYLIAGTLSGLACAAVYYPTINDPLFAYSVPEILDFSSIDQAKMALEKEGYIDPDAEMISKKIVLPRWNGGNSVGELTQKESLERVKEILPYTKGMNFVNLVNAPLRVMDLHMSLLAIAIVVLMIFVNVVRDPPKGAYIDKLGIAFFAFLVFEVIHGYLLWDIVEWEVYLKFDGIGKLVTTPLVLLLAFVAIRRYVFLSEGFGRYYESVLIKNPRSITQWRDGLDNMILREFFKSKSTFRRFFQTTQGDSAINRKNSEKTLDKKT